MSSMRIKELPESKRAMAVIALCAGTAALLAGVGGSLATPSDQPRELYDESVSTESDIPGVMAGGRETWPLAGPDGVPLEDQFGRVALIDPELADDVIESTLPVGRRAAPEHRVTDDGVTEAVHHAEAQPYFENLELLEREGAVTYLDPGAREFDDFCKYSDDAICRDGR